MVAYSDQLCELLYDRFETKRPSMTNKYDREPLLASRQGGLQKTTLRTYVYR